MATGVEKILVPLKYDKNYTFKTSFSDDRKFSLEEQSFLSIYKDAAGDYKVEVVTICPDINFLNNLNQKFQGLVTIDDWNENRIKTYSHRDGKVYSIGAPHFNQSARTSEICMTVYWYWCEGWESNISECTYLGYTTYEDCSENQTLLPPGNGEGEEYVDIINVNRSMLWSVNVDPDWGQVAAVDEVYGVKSYTHPTQNRFTNITAGNSYLINSFSYTNGPNDPTPKPCAYDYIQDSHGVSLNSQYVSSSVACHYLTQGVDANGYASGVPTTKYKLGSKGWIFSDCF